MTMNTTTDLLNRAIVALRAQNIDIDDFYAFIDDDGFDQRDALDCETVSFDSVEADLAEMMFYEGQIEDGDFGPYFDPSIDHEDDKILREHTERKRVMKSFKDRPVYKDHHDTAFYHTTYDRMKRLEALTKGARK